MNALIKIYFLAITFACSPIALNAAYLTYISVEVTQPDGTELNIFTSGDEFYNWLHDENGFTIVQDGITGVYCYANLIDEQLLPTNILPGVDDPENNGLLPNINLPPEVLSQTIDVFTENTPASISREDFLSVDGQVRLNNIVVYIRFADQDEFPAEQQKYSDMFNKKGENLNTVANYFEEASYNKLDVNTTFYPANNGTMVLSYKDSEDRSYYAQKTATNPNGYDKSDFAERARREHNLLLNAIDLIKDEIPQSLDIDFNNDGKVDNISFILNGSRGSFGQILWPHRWAFWSARFISSQLFRLKSDK